MAQSNELRVSPPFIFKDDDGNYHGYCIDILNEITKITGKKFVIYLSPNNGYGRKIGRSWNGMMGEVIKKNADLGIGDFTITDQRRRAVDFTLPILDVGVTAMLSKRLIYKITSFSDLVNQSEIPYGMLMGGGTAKYFATSVNPIGQLVNQYVSTHPQHLVRSHTEAIERVLKGNYVFIGESAAIEYIVANHNDLTEISSGWFVPRSYGIAVPKYSSNIISFNFAISHMRNNGMLMELKKKWWKSRV